VCGVRKDWVVRDARVEDRDQIVEFNWRLASETESKTLDRDTLTRGVTRVLEDPNLGRYLIAEWTGDGSNAGQPVGQMMRTFEWSDWRNGMIWWIQSVYVHADHRGMGIFRDLLSRMIEQAGQAEDVLGLRLYVENNNEPALATYRKLGFLGDEYSVMERFNL